MPSYDQIDDEDELHKILSNTDDFEERKKIRARMKELREKHSQEVEKKRLEREKNTEDIIRRKYEQSEKEKKEALAQFDKMAKTASAEMDKHLQAGQDLLKDKLRHAEEDKKAKLAGFDRIAKKDVKTTVTTQKTPAKPQGARGAMAAFKQMDANAPKPNLAVPGGRGGGAGRGRGGGVMRSPSAIKQMLIDWCASKTKEYENVSITNLSTSWNNGLAFCALIHHFYPEAFDYSKLEAKNRRYNFDLAFNTAEKYADIAPLLDTDDMVKMQKPDWKCVFTYVQSFYRKLHDHDANKQSSEQ